jgi:hypothetical protein
MVSPVAQLTTRLAYGATQLSRVAWYVGHGEIMRRLSQRVRERDGEKARPKPQTDRPVPERRRLFADMAKLFQQDLANVEAGIYPLPADHDGSLFKLLRRSRLFFEDLADVHRRRESGEKRQVFTDETRGKRPAYYLQNFHFQSGGWLTDDSAQRYDTQVEVLFNGSANAIRRQVLVPLREVFAGRDQRQLSLLTSAVAPGASSTSSNRLASPPRRRFRHVGQLSDGGPTPSQALGLAQSRGRQSRGHPTAGREPGCNHLRVSVSRAAAQGAAAGARRVRARAQAGGRLVLLDSLQYGDEPDYDGMLELFPQSFHEPYYAGYLTEDFPALAAEHGLAHVRDVNAFTSKVMVFDKR